jgi:hypothetical protein
MFARWGGEWGDLVEIRDAVRRKNYGQDAGRLIDIILTLPAELRGDETMLAIALW